MEFRSGGLLFTSKFDSGNLARVERVLADNDDEPGIRRIGDPGINADYEFNVWTNPDCAGTNFENGNRTWFHFAIKGCPMNKLIKINVMNLNKQGKLYNQGMSPVVKVIPQKPKWERIRDKPTTETVDGQFMMSFTYRFEYRFSAVYFAFCYPYSYAEYQTKLEELDSKLGAACSSLSSNSSPNTIYYHRELLCYSRDRLRVDLVTVSSCHGLTNEEEPRLDRLFPDQDTPRCRKFKGKRVFFLSSRVHPGETPASFVFNGFLDFILRPKDPRAVQLRKQYVFKLIPLLNPDGVQRGHYRTDQRGVNLNRMYLNPDPELHPSIFASKSLILYHHLHSRMKSQPDNAHIFDKQSQQQQRPKTSHRQRQSASAVLISRQSVRSAQSTRTIQQDTAMSDEEDPYGRSLNKADGVDRKPNAIVMVHDGSAVSGSTKGSKVRAADADTAAGGDSALPPGDVANGANGLPDGFESSHPLTALTRDASTEELSDGEDGDLCQKTSLLSLADSTAPSTPVVPSYKEEDLLAIPPQESGIAFYVDLHGHASKRGCFIYGNHLPFVEEQIENLLYPKLIAMNSAYFDFDGCNFSEKNMYTKDKRDAGVSKEGSGRVAVHKATGIIHSYTLECNYNTGRFMNSISPATMDDGKATPPPVAGFPPKYTMAHYEDVGRAVAIAALDMTDTNPWSRLASTEYMTVHGVRGWVQRYLRSVRGAPKLPNKMSRVASKTSSIVASATSQTGMHSKARQALSDNDHHHQSTRNNHGIGNHANNNSNRKPATMGNKPARNHLGPVRETRASIERKKRLAQIHQQQNHREVNNKPPTVYNTPSHSSYTVNTPAPCSRTSQSPVNVTFTSGASQNKPHGHGGVQGKLSWTHKNFAGGGHVNVAGGGGAHVNNSNNQGVSAGSGGVKTVNKIQPSSMRMPPKGSKKVIEELINHMVVNTLDAMKKTNNKDAETARLQYASETRPLGQPVGEAARALVQQQHPKSPIGQRLFQSTNRKKVGGAKGDDVSKPNKVNQMSPKRRGKKVTSFKRRSSSHSPSRKGLQGRKSSETDSETEFKGARMKSRASTIASGFSDPSANRGELTGSVSPAPRVISPALKPNLHPQTDKLQVSTRRRSTGTVTTETPYLRPSYLDHVTMPPSLTTRSLSPNPTVSCQVLDLNSIQQTKPVIKNTNYWPDN